MIETRENESVWEGIWEDQTECQSMRDQESMRDYKRNQERMKGNERDFGIVWVCMRKYSWELLWMREERERGSLI